MLLSDIIINLCDTILEKQKDDGSFPSGHNGPYHDPETPVRNTAHWLFLLATLYERTRDTKWKVASEKAVAYLLGSEARPNVKTFHIRDKDGKDHCNGLVGQAWVIEALIKAGEVFERHDCYDLAEEVFLLHPWDVSVSIWQRVEIDGTVLSYDGTFNHQLWFAAAGGLLTRTPGAQKRAEIFLENIAANVQLYPNGVIFHASAMGNLAGYLKNGLKAFLRELRSRYKRKQRRIPLYSKSAGYHGFNLYALAMLKNAIPNAMFWNTSKFQTLLRAYRTELFSRDVQVSEYGYHYNLSGIEIAYAVETFLDDKKEANAWLDLQFQETYVSQNHPLSRNAVDPVTVDARIYQAARLKRDYEVHVG